MGLFGHRVEKPRKFNGKNYRYLGFHENKSDATEHAKKTRRHGHSARVLKVSKGYEVWMR